MTGREAWYRRGARGALAGVAATVAMSVVQFPGALAAGDAPPPVELTRRLDRRSERRPRAVTLPAMRSCPMLAPRERSNERRNGMATELEDLAARLQRVEDELAVRRIVLSYGPAADAGLAARAGALWARDG